MRTLNDILELGILVAYHDSLGLYVTVYKSSLYMWAADTSGPVTGFAFMHCRMFEDAPLGGIIEWSGRTLQNRAQEFIQDMIRLGQLEATGLLKFSNAETERRYPRLIKAIMACGVYSRTEAMACVRDHANGMSSAGEAVARAGGTRAVIRAAIHWHKLLRSRGVKV